MYTVYPYSTREALFIFFIRYLVRGSDEKNRGKGNKTLARQGTSRFGTDSGSFIVDLPLRFGPVRSLIYFACFLLCCFRSLLIRALFFVSDLLRRSLINVRFRTFYHPRSVSRLVLLTIMGSYWRDKSFYVLFFRFVVLYWRDLGFDVTFMFRSPYFRLLMLYIRCVM